MRSSVVVRTVIKVAVALVVVAMVFSMVHVQIQIQVQMPHLGLGTRAASVTEVSAEDAVQGFQEPLVVRRQPRTRAPPRQLGVFTIGTSAGSGCFELADHATDNSYDVSNNTCNSKNCPSCFITSTSISVAPLLTITNCNNHRWGIGTVSTKREGTSIGQNGMDMAWSYTFINRASSLELTIEDGQGSQYVVPGRSHVFAYCDSTASAGRLYFPSSTVPTLTVQSGLTVSAGNFAHAGTGTFSTGTGTISLNGHTTVASDKNLHMTGAGSFQTGTDTVALNGHVSVASGKNLSMTSDGAGTFQTGTGTVTLNGHTTVASGLNLHMTSSGTGTFKTGAGAVTLFGDTVINGAKSFSTGTGGVSLNSNTEVTSSYNLVMNAGGTGSFTSGGGTVTLNGHTTLASGMNLHMTGASTFQTGTSAVSLNGHVTVASNKNLLMVSSGTGAFTTGTGAVSLYGHTTVQSNKQFTSGTGAITLNGNVALSGTTTFTTGTGAVALNGHVTVASGKNLLMTSSGTGAFQTGAGNVDLYGSVKVKGTNAFQVGVEGTAGTTKIFGNLIVGADGSSNQAVNTVINGNFVQNDESGGTSTFKTASGAITIAGNTVISSGKTLTLGDGSVDIQCGASESGSLSSICVPGR